LKAVRTVKTVKACSTEEDRIQETEDSIKNGEPFGYAQGLRQGAAGFAFSYAVPRKSEISVKPEIGGRSGHF
jgi:hypothetical protein